METQVKKQRMVKRKGSPQRASSPTRRRRSPSPSTQPVIPPADLRDVKFLYKRFFNGHVKKPLDMVGTQWFSQLMGYGSNETYGPIIQTYAVTNVPRLLDLSQDSVRDAINKALAEPLDPDVMYGGGSGNKSAHKRIQKSFPDFHGTIIDEGRTYNEDWQGATEVVLWAPVGDFLTEK